MSIEPLHPDTVDALKEELFFQLNVQRFITYRGEDFQKTGQWRDKVNNIRNWKLCYVGIPDLVLHLLYPFMTDSMYGREAEWCLKPTLHEPAGAYIDRVIDAFIRVRGE